MTAPAPRAPTAPPGIGQIARQFPGWLRGNALTALLTAVVGGLFGYISNVWLIAVRYEGTDVPSGSPATSNGSFVQGALFWTLFSTLIFGIAGYWQAVGTSKLLADLRGMPRALAGLVRGDRAAYVHLLWGAAVSMIAAVVLSPSVGAVLGFGLLAIIPGVLGSVLSSAMHQVWSALVGRVAPTRRQRVTGITGLTVGLLGSAAALLVAFFVSSTGVKWLLAGVFAVLAVLLSRLRSSSGTAALILLVLGTAAALYQLMDAPPAAADDGGWTECQGTPWLDCAGSTAVLVNSTVGAVVAALGAVAGTFAGWLAGALSGFGGGPPPGGGPGGEHPPGAGPLVRPAEPAPSAGPPALSPLPGLEPAPPGAPLPPLPPGPDAAAPKPTAPAEPPPGGVDGRIPYTEAIRARLHQLDIETTDPSRYDRFKGLLAGLDPAKGVTPDWLGALQRLESDHDAASNARLTTIRTEQAAFARQGMTDLVAAIRKGTKAEHDYDDYIKQLNRVEAASNALTGLIGRLAPGQQDVANRVLTRIQEGEPGTDKEGQIRTLTNVVLRQAQARADTEAAAAAARVGDFDAAAATAKQAATQVALTALTGGAVAVGLVTAAQVGALSLTAAAVRGATTGYTEGGVRGAAWGTTKATMPVNTVQATADLVAGKGGAGDLLVAVVQDAGNVATLVAVGAGLRNLRPAAAAPVAEPVAPGPAPPVAEPVAPGPAPPGAPAAGGTAAGAPAAGAGPKAPGPPAPGVAPQAVSKTLGTEGITDVRGFLKGVNPNPSRQGLGYTKEGLFHPDGTPRTPLERAADTNLTNCGNCTIATDAKLAGNPLPPAPPSSGFPVDLMENMYGNRFTKVQSRMTIDSTLKVAGPGSRGIVYGLYPKAPPPGSPPGTPSVPTAHVFNAVNDGGVVKYLDGQTGKPASFRGFVQLRFMRTG
ncbi:toxin glutamine deamidase domain-containing protein [Kitasatospora sp. NPDC127111]|uniref:toxin glutamine deamidase domain-containing protein n=1 Tax=Kitasatospora sp. NPDC127111 TaxID=3345363 RepID=UPI003629A0E6